MTDDAAESATLTPEEKARRAGSFGGIAAQYERYRPGPPLAAVDWILPEGAQTVVDLGAGTGALTRLLVGRVPHVVAVEPDDRMRALLSEAVPAARAVAGRGESMPLPDASADAVIASTSWHWMDLVPTLTEVARVLVPGGDLGVLWSGPDPQAAFMAQAQDAMRAFGQSGVTGETGETDEGAAVLAHAINDPVAGHQVLEIPPGVPFDQPESTEFKWDQALTADDLLGLLGTFSWVIVMDDDARRGLYETARTLLRQDGVVGDVTIDVGYSATVWKARRHS
ncbi:MAG TPA: class I SAM-dependent methyltransferase [Acidimicrobiales bacterium]|nr:class I SAM-dependent methyltransferase [Acidimicrobiales bacterium]